MDDLVRQLAQEMPELFAESPGLDTPLILVDAVIEGSWPDSELVIVFESEERGGRRFGYRTRVADWGGGTFLEEQGPSRFADHVWMEIEDWAWADDGLPEGDDRGITWYGA
jgi:hypothetical protein